MEFENWKVKRKQELIKKVKSTKCKGKGKGKGSEERSMQGEDGYENKMKCHDHFIDGSFLAAFVIILQMHSRYLVITLDHTFYKPLTINHLIPGITYLPTLLSAGYPRHFLHFYS